MSNTFMQRQVDERVHAWEEAKHLLDTAAAEKRDLTAEETEQYERITADIDRRAKIIEDFQQREERERKLDVAAADIRVPEIAQPIQSDADSIRALARGEVRSAEFHAGEQRAITGGSTGSPVPTSFYDRVIMLARLVGPMLDTSTVLNTTGGENLQIPRIATYSGATPFGQGSAIGTSEPTFGSFITLGAFKYSFLIQVSQELIDDSGVDLLGFIADQTGNAMGFSVNAALTTGTGTVQPTGIVPASAAGGTGGTGVSGAFTADNLIDLAYSLDGAVMNLPGTGWMMNTAAVGATRKLKDTAGYYVFSPRLSPTEADTLLGFPIYMNPAMASTATSAKSVIFGHLPSYYVRQVGGLKLDRSDEYAFNQGLVTFRATMRVDGNLPQTTHIKHFVGAAS
jgi:hypothetical protein